MSRAVLTLVGGVVVTLLAVLLLTPIPLLASRGFVLVVLTAAAGTLVMVVVGRRASLRRRAGELDDRVHRQDPTRASTAPSRHLPRRQPDATGTTDRPTDEESDRG